MSYKTKVVTLAVAIGGFQAHEQYFTDPVPERLSVVSKPRSSYSNNTFHCDGRQHCSQMTSREEAEFFVRNCPNTKMDGDRDGIPCERDSRW